jgi:RNA polymerase sigma-70 factor (ECF subfamily)
VNFDALANEHKDAIYRQMLRVCGNREDAEDVLIEALLKANTSMDQLRDSASFRAWLAQIGRRVCWQLKASERLIPILQLSQLEDAGHDVVDTAASPEDALASAQMRKILSDAIAGLSPEVRAVYELRDLQDLSGDETAGQLGISLAAMKSRLHRARSSLREHMEAALAKSTADSTSERKRHAIAN